MNKFRSEKRRYFQTGVSGYIGSGNNTQVFSRRSTPSFSRLKQIYGEHLENYTNHKTGFQKNKKISEELKKKIRSQLRKEYQRNFKNTMISILISIIIFIGFVYVIVKAIFHFWPELN